MPQAHRYWNLAAQPGQQPGKTRVLLTFYGDLTAYPNDLAEDRSPQEIADALTAAGEIEQITARINSPGGDAFAGVAIGNLLRDWPVPVTTIIDGFAGSAASLVFVAGDERIMPVNTLLYIHDPWTIAAGNARDLRQEADALDTVAGAIAASYRRVTGKSLAELRAMMTAETLMTADEALAMEFATAVDTVPIAASISGSSLLMNGISIDTRKRKITLTPAARSAVGAPPLPQGQAGDRYRRQPAALTRARRVGAMLAGISGCISPRDRA